MDNVEPPSQSSSCPFLIGKNSHGNWVVQDQRGLCGGLFINRAEALRFALFENGRRPQAIIMIPDGLELDMGGRHEASIAPAETKTSSQRSNVLAFPQRAPHATEASAPRAVARR
jgi:hypothetical protein